MIGHMKNFIFGFLAAGLVVVVGVFAYRTGLNQSSPPPVLSPNPTIELSEIPLITVAPSITKAVISDDDAIKQALLNKHNWNANEVDITISKNDGTYASGGAKEKAAEAGGGYFFAAKANGEWKIVADGNGTISCESLAPYPDYPATMIPECWNEATNKLIKR